MVPAAMQRRYPRRCRRPSAPIPASTSACWPERGQVFEDHEYYLVPVTPSRLPRCRQTTRTPGRLAKTGLVGATSQLALSSLRGITQWRATSVFARPAQAGSRRSACASHRPNCAQKLPGRFDRRHRRLPLQRTSPDPGDMIAERRRRRCDHTDTTGMLESATVSLRSGRLQVPTQTDEVEKAGTAFRDRYGV